MMFVLVLILLALVGIAWILSVVLYNVLLIPKATGDEDLTKNLEVISYKTQKSCSSCGKAVDGESSLQAEAEIPLIGDKTVPVTFNICHECAA